MRVTLVRRPGEAPVVIEAAMVLVEDHLGTPISVAHEQGRAPSSAYVVAHAHDKNFNAILRQLGLDKTVVCDDLVLPPPPSGATLWRPDT